jgi:hypothetical protein
LIETPHLDHGVYKLAITVEGHAAPKRSGSSTKMPFRPYELGIAVVGKV